MVAPTKDGGSQIDALVSDLAARDTVPWYRKPNLRTLYILMFPTLIGVEMTSGFDSSMMNGLQAVDSWDEFFHSPRSAILGLMSASYSLGAAVALPFVPSVTDHWGRRFAIVFGSIIMIIGAALQTASVNLAMFVISRVILGTGIVFAIVAASALIGELSYPKERAILGSLFNSCYFIGSIVAAGVTFGTFGMPNNWGWRIPSVLQIVPSIMQIAFIYFIPESPRWLINKGRGDEAYAILVKYHAEGDTDSEFVKAEYAQIEQTIQLEMENAKMSWKEVTRTAGMRKRFFIAGFLGLFTQWSGNGLLSYFLPRILETVGIKDNKRKNTINLANTCWGFVNATAFALTATRFPRRRMYLIGTISLTVVFTALTIASAQFAQTGSHPSSIATIFLIFLYSPAYNICYNALTYAFLVELFPFHVRAKGITFFQWFGRGASFFNQFVNPIGLADAGWKYYITYCVFLGFEVLFVFIFFPETSGKTLEELTFLYEGEELRKEQEKRIADELREEEKRSSSSPSEKEKTV